MPDDCDDKLPASRKEPLPEQTEKRPLARFYSRAKGIARDLTDKAPYVGKALDAYDAIKTGKEIYDAAEGEREKAITAHKEPPSFLDAAISKASEIIKSKITNEQELRDAFLNSNPYSRRELDIPKEELAKNSKLQQRMIESLNALDFSRKNPDASLDMDTAFKTEIARIGVSEGWQKAATFDSDYNTVFKLTMNGYGDPDRLADVLNKHSLLEARYNLSQETKQYGESVIQKFINEASNHPNIRAMIREASLEPTRLDKTGWAHEMHNVPPDTHSLHTTSQEIIRGAWSNTGCSDKSSPSKDIEPDR